MRLRITPVSALLCASLGTLCACQSPAPTSGSTVTTTLTEPSTVTTTATTTATAPTETITSWALTSPSAPTRTTPARDDGRWSDLGPYPGEEICRSHADTMRAELPAPDRWQIGVCELRDGHWYLPLFEPESTSEATSESGEPRPGR